MEKNIDVVKKDESKLDLEKMLSEYYAVTEFKCNSVNFIELISDGPIMKDGNVSDKFTKYLLNLIFNLPDDAVSINDIVQL